MQTSSSSANTSKDGLRTMSPLILLATSSNNGLYSLEAVVCDLLSQLGHDVARDDHPH